MCFRNNLTRLLIFLFCQMNLSVQGVDAGQQQLKAEQLKSVFILNFISYIEWPETSVEDNSPYTIGVYGETPVYNLLKPMESKPVSRKPFRIVKVNSLENTSGLHVIFVSREKRGDLNSLFEKSESQSILTVGEIDHFAKQGGIINFILVDGKIHFEINLGAAEKAGLKISSKLLKLAKIIETEGI